MPRNSEGSGRLRILLIDDHSMVLDTFGLFLRTESGMSVETSSSLPRGFALVGEKKFDIILLDLNMPGMTGLAGLREMVARAPGTPVAILTGSASPKIIDDIMQAGASGLILKTSSAATMSAAIQFMSTGAHYLPPETRHKNHAGQERTLIDLLTDRERTVLGRLIDGQLNREIADALGVAETTIKMHVMSICRKFGVKNRTQAAVLARTIDSAGQS